MDTCGHILDMAGTCPEHDYIYICIPNFRHGWTHLHMTLGTFDEDLDTWGVFSVCEGTLASKRRRRRSRRRKKRRRRRGRRMMTDQHSRPLSFSWFSDLKTPLVRNANLRYERERKREGGLSNVLSARDLGETYRGFLAMYYLLTACWGWEWHRIMLSFWCSYTTLPKTYGSFSDVYLAREEYLFQERGLLTPCLCLHYQEIAMAPCLCFVGWRYLLYMVSEILMLVITLYLFEMIIKTAKDTWGLWRNSYHN